MRIFDESDRKKKSGRITLPDNPGGLTSEVLAKLETAVTSALKDGYVSCPVGWKIARDLDISRLDVGAMIDKLGIRVTDCSLGCFKVSKTGFAGKVRAPFSEEAAYRIEVLEEQGALTCANVFGLAKELGVEPMSLADAANVRGYKIRHCQLGCF